MERKALFLDMDGTTLNDEIQIPKENYEAMGWIKRYIPFLNRHAFERNCQWQVL